MLCNANDTDRIIFEILNSSISILTPPKLFSIPNQEPGDVQTEINNHNNVYDRRHVERAVIQISSCSWVFSAEQR